MAAAGPDLFERLLAHSLYCTTVSAGLTCACASSTVYNESLAAHEAATVEHWLHEAGPAMSFAC